MKTILTFFLFFLIPYAASGGIGKPLPNIPRVIDKLPQSQNNALPAPQHTVLQPVEPQQIKQPVSLQKQNNMIKDQTKSVSKNDTWALPVIVLFFIITIIVFFINFYMKRQKTDKGMSLLELLISLVIILVIIMTFAMVFPTGMRLNAANLRTNKGMEIASGTIEEIKNMPLCNQRNSPCPTDFNTEGAVRSLECLSINWNETNKKGIDYWRPTSLPQTTFYTIPASNGVILEFQQSRLTTSGLAIPCDALSNYFVSVTVRIQWTDIKTGELKTSVAKSYFNSNK